MPDKIKTFVYLTNSEEKIERAYDVWFQNLEQPIEIKKIEQSVVGVGMTTTIVVTIVYDTKVLKVF